MSRYAAGHQGAPPRPHQLDHTLHSNTGEKPHHTPGIIPGWQPTAGAGVLFGAHTGLKFLSLWAPALLFIFLQLPLDEELSDSPICHSSFILVWVQAPLIRVSRAVFRCDTPFLPPLPLFLPPDIPTRSLCTPISPFPPNLSATEHHGNAFSVFYSFNCDIHYTIFHNTF